MKRPPLEYQLSITSSTLVGKTIWYHVLDVNTPSRYRIESHSLLTLIRLERIKKIFGIPVPYKWFKEGCKETKKRFVRK